MLLRKLRVSQNIVFLIMTHWSCSRFCLVRALISSSWSCYLFHTLGYAWSSHSFTIKNMSFKRNIFLLFILKTPYLRFDIFQWFDELLIWRLCLLIMNIIKLSWLILIQSYYIWRQVLPYIFSSLHIWIIIIELISILFSRVIVVNIILLWIQVNNLLILIAINSLLCSWEITVCTC